MKSAKMRELERLEKIMVDESTPVKELKSKIIFGVFANTELGYNIEEAQDIVAQDLDGVAIDSKEFVRLVVAEFIRDNK